MLIKVMQLMCFHVCVSFEYSGTVSVVNVKVSHSQQRSFAYSTVAESACLILRLGQGGKWS